MNKIKKISSAQRVQTTTSIWKDISTLVEKGQSCVVITITNTRGSVPGLTGSKGLVDAGGLLAGNLGGGKVEAKAIEQAKSLLNKQDTLCISKTWNLQSDVGMTCGGEMSFLFEFIQSKHRWHIVIFGAGHVSQALVPLLCTLPCRLDLIDTRKDWLKKTEKHPRLKKHLVEKYEQGVDCVTATSYVLSITQGHSTDSPVLLHTLKKYKVLPYLGVIGSVAKRAILLKELHKAGIKREHFEKIICPLGLALGSNHPAEIAISIVAQLLQTRDKLSNNTETS